MIRKVFWWLSARLLLGVHRLRQWMARIGTVEEIVYTADGTAITVKLNWRGRLILRRQQEQSLAMSRSLPPALLEMPMIEYIPAEDTDRQRLQRINPCSL